MQALRSPPSTDTAFSFAVLRVDPSRASLSASGELDLAAVGELTALLAAHESAGRAFIRLDLSAVTFMDCSCLGVLVAAHYRLRAAHGQLILTCSSGPVIKLISLTHLEDTLLATIDDDDHQLVGRVPLPRLTPADQMIPNGGAAR